LRARTYARVEGLYWEMRHGASCVTGWDPPPGGSLTLERGCPILTGPATGCRVAAYQGLFASVPSLDPAGGAPPGRCAMHSPRWTRCGACRGQELLRSPAARPSSLHTPGAALPSPLRCLWCLWCLSAPRYKKLSAARVSDSFLGGVRKRCPNPPYPPRYSHRSPSKSCNRYRATPSRTPSGTIRRPSNTLPLLAESHFPSRLPLILPPSPATASKASRNSG